MNRSSLQQQADTIIDKYNDIYQSLKNKNDYRKVLVLVEGPDDYFIYGLLLKPTRVVLEEHCSVQSGCAQVMDMLKELNRRPFIIKKKRVNHLAILDADFNRVLNRLSDEENLVYTDSHDNEMMTLSTSNTMENLCYTFGIPQEEIESVRSCIWSELLTLTQLKWYNEEFQFGANFKGLDLQNMSLKELAGVDELFSLIQGRSGNCTASLHGFKEYIKTHTVDTNNQYEVTNGHDFVSRMQTLLRNRYKCQKNEKYVERYLQLQLSFNKFTATDLCARIHEWENKAGITESIVGASDEKLSEAITEIAKCSKKDARYISS